MPPAYPDCAVVTGYGCRTPPRTPTLNKANAAKALTHLRSADEGLSLLIGSLGPFKMQVQRPDSTFAALAEAIAYQQLSPKAAATIHGRFCALFGPGCQPTPEAVLALPEGQLRAAGLSGAKAAAMIDLARRTLTGEVPDLDEAARLADEELVERFSSVRGIGRWTAQMFLMFSLGRLDVLPLGDYGLRRGFGIAFAGGRAPTANEVEGRAEVWRPYRTVACWYLWRAAEAGTPLSGPEV